MVTIEIIIEVAVYSVLFTIMIGLYLHDRAKDKLRAEHRAELAAARAEMEALRGEHDAKCDALRGYPRVLPLSPTSPYVVAYNKVGREQMRRVEREEIEKAKQMIDELSVNSGRMLPDE